MNCPRCLNETESLREKVCDGDVFMCEVCGAFALVEGDQLREPSRRELYRITVRPEFKRVRRHWLIQQ